jgi:hypothetical protein
MLELLYGCGMRVGECCTLRVRDVDFDRAQILVRQAKGDKDRTVMLPATLRQPLQDQIRRVEARWQRDLLRGGGYVPVPASVRHKCPSAWREFKWQYLFPSAVLRRDAEGRGHRWHTHPSVLDRAVARAARRAGGEQARQLPHVPAQLRHAPAGTGGRRTSGPSVARAHAPEDDDDLHPRDEQAVGGPDQPAGPAPTIATVNSDTRRRLLGRRISTRPRAAPRRRMGGAAARRSGSLAVGHFWIRANSLCLRTPLARIVLNVGSFYLTPSH